MKRMVWLLQLTLIFLLMLTLAAAEYEEYSVIEPTTERIKINAGMSNDEALEGFINKAFGIAQTGARASRGSLRGDKLSGAEKNLYDFLKRCVAEIAAGNRSSTAFSISYIDLFDGTSKKMSYMASELGVDVPVVDGHFTQEAVNAFYDLIEVDSTSVLNALLADCPYEMFWYDKSNGSGFLPAGCTANSQMIYLKQDAQYTIEMHVAPDYSKDRTSGTTDYDTTVSTTILKAAATAQKIVRDNSALSDMGKLHAYLETICDLVSYNFYALNNNVDYGNPWQLIWVFDGDPATEVVCEGYAKAFKYLCDISTFETDISVFLATGDMVGATGAGSHMWNLVEMGETSRYRYLVDVTNCDSGSVGYPDHLFMTGYSPITDEDIAEMAGYGFDVDEDTYMYVSGTNKIFYKYKGSTLNLYSAEERTVLAEETIQRLPEPGISDLTLSDSPDAGEELSVRVSFPNGTRAVRVNFYKLNDNYEILSEGPEFFLNTAGIVTVRGYWFSGGGLFRFTAQALSHDAGEEYQLLDSKTTINNVQLNETVPAQLPAFDFPDTVQFGESVTYIIPEMDGVVSQCSGEWGKNEPLENLTGNTQTITFTEPGETTVQFWGFANQTWTAPTTKIVNVGQPEPLGTLSDPEVEWCGMIIEENMLLTVVDTLAFEVNAPGADNVNFEVMRDEDVALFEIGNGSIDGDTGEMNLTSIIREPGSYRINVRGQRYRYEDGVKSFDIHWMEDGDFTVVDGVLLKYHGFSSPTELTIPEELVGQEIKGIGPEAFMGSTGLIAVNLPDSLEWIGDYAFNGCTGLNSITIPAGVAELGAGAFMDSGLIQVNVPANAMTKIWEFYEPDASGNPRVYHVALPLGIETVNAPFLHTAMASDSPDYVLPQSLDRIDEESFTNTDAHFVWIGDQATGIGDDAFAGCQGLKLRIPGNVTSIGNNALPVGTVVYVEKGTEGERYALKNNLIIVPYVESCTSGSAQ